MHQNKLGCLVIHGFGGGIYEIEALADYLTDKDYLVVCPKLKGHTGNGRDMKGATYEDWIKSAEESLLILKEKTDSIAIIGFSMGGLIAVNLACKYDVKVLVTINTPIFYWNIPKVLFNLMDDVKNKRLNNVNRYLNAKKSSPLISMINFLLMLNKTKPKLKEINCPFLINQALDDDTVKVRSVDYIYNNISSESKKIKYYENGGHLILTNNAAQKVSADIEEFLKSLSY